MSVQLTKEQMQELGIAEYSPGEREAFYMRVGKVVFDSALLRLIENLSDEQLNALNHAIDSHDSFEAVVAYLQNTYPQFGKYIEVEQELFIDQFTTQQK